MSTNTQVIWNWPVDPADSEAIFELHLQQEQYATAPLDFVDNSPLPGQRTINRHWDSVEHAQEWIDLMLPFNPVSAVIVT